MGLFWHGITHDISKLLPSEFIGYAQNFFGDTIQLSCEARYKYGVHCNEELPIGALPEDRFKKSWLLHQHRNKHHWDYWVASTGKPVPMPMKYVKQMICDWRAMGRQIGDTVERFYKEKGHEMKMHSITRDIIALELRK